MKSRVRQPANLDDIAVLLREILVEVRKINEPKEKKPTPRAAKFIPPSIWEVEQYAASKKLQIDAKRFVYFYASKDWCVGKNKMKCWKSAVANWARPDSPAKQEIAF